MNSEVRELLTEELKDAYSAEKQALRSMQKTLRKISTEALREGIQMHIGQTQVQIERVEQAMEKLEDTPPPEQPPPPSKSGRREVRPESETRGGHESVPQDDEAERG
jgi:hypothetical protein